MKEFSLFTGLQMDSTFEFHRTTCTRCAAFDRAKPSTAGAMCLEGSVLWKRDNVAAKKKPPEPVDEFRGTKAQVQAAMRYKE